MLKYDLSSEVPANDNDSISLESLEAHTGRPRSDGVEQLAPIDDDFPNERASFINKPASRNNSDSSRRRGVMYIKEEIVEDSRPTSTEL